MNETDLGSSATGIEGVVVAIPGGRLVARGQMDVVFQLLPWRVVGSVEWVHEPLELIVPMDVDLADAWLSSANPGDGVGASSVALAGLPGAWTARAAGLLRTLNLSPRDEVNPESLTPERVPSRFPVPVPEGFWAPLPKSELHAWET